MAVDVSSVGQVACACTDATARDSYVCDRNGERGGGKRRHTHTRASKRERNEKK